MLFDTRYFWAVFTEKNPEQLRKLRSILEDAQNPSASVITIYEIYKLSINNEDKTVADLRVDYVKKGFTIVDVDPEIAEEGARISHQVKVPMADALIMATARKLRDPCATDDPHFTEVKRVWI